MPRRAFTSASVMFEAVMKPLSGATSPLYRWFGYGPEEAQVQSHGTRHLEPSASHMRMTRSPPRRESLDGDDNLHRAMLVQTASGQSQLRLAPCLGNCRCSPCGVQVGRATSLDGTLLLLPRSLGKAFQLFVAEGPRLLYELLTRTAMSVWTSTGSCRTLSRCLSTVLS
jgi:hypothetical protein